MKNMLLASVAVLSLAAAPAFAQTTTNAEADAGAAVGGAAGGATGAVVGGLIFGPIGAVIGGFTGATLGAQAGVEASSVEYARLNPTDPITVEGELEVGYVLPETITVHPIEGDENFGYFYTEDRVWFVDLSDRSVVYSPGTVVAVEQ